MMQQIRIPLALAVLTILTGCAAPPPPEPVRDAPEDIAAIGAVRQAFMDAYAAGDADAMVSHYTADAISEPNHNATLVGRDAIAEALRAMFAAATLEVELTPAETRTLGTAGFDRGTYIATVTPKAGGLETTTEGRYFVLMVKEDDGQWRAMRDMDNIGAPPPMAEDEMDMPAEPEAE